MFVGEDVDDHIDEENDGISVIHSLKGVEFLSVDSVHEGGVVGVLEGAYETEDN